MNEYNSIFKFAPGPGITFTDLVAKSDYGKANFVFIYQDGVWENYAKPEDEHKLNQEGLELYSDKEKTDELFAKIDGLTKRIISLTRDFDNLDLGSLSEGEFLKVFSQQISLIVEYLDYYYLTEYFFFDSIEEKINEALEKKFDTKDLPNILTALLSSPPENNLLTEEKIDRSKIALKLNDDRFTKQLILNKNCDELRKSKSFSLVKAHAEKWGFLNYKDGKKYQTVEEVLELLSENLQNTDKSESFIKDIVNQSAKLTEEQKKLEKELPPEIVWLGNVVRQMQEKKFELRILLNKSFFGDESIISLLFREISKRFYIAMNQLEFMAVEEIEELFQTGNFPLKEIIDRQESFAYVPEGGTYQLATGEKAKGIIRLVKPVIESDLHAFRGNTANFGFAKGKAKLIRLTTKVQVIQEEIANMENGQILVTETTGPELILAVKKASAIVTNEGGINSHAAIVSRELNIPCIIGTKIATEVIKDGDIIEVDADKGEVRIIQKGTL